MALSDDSEIKEKILTDPDFVNLKRYNYSLDRVLERYQDSPIPDRVIAQALNLTEAELQATFDGLIEKLRYTMGVDDET